MYDTGFDYSPLEWQQQQYQAQNITQKIDSALFLQDALRVAAYHPYNSPSALYANSPLGGFGSAVYTPQNSFAAATLNVLNNIPQQTQFIQIQQPQQQPDSTPLRVGETNIIEEGQINGGANLTPTQISNQQIPRGYAFYDLQQQSIDSPHSGSFGQRFFGGNFQQINPPGSSQQQQTQIQPSTSSTNANYSFSSVASALKKSQYYDSPRNFSTAFIPYTQAVGFSPFMQVPPTSDSLKQPQFFQENEEYSPLQFFQNQQSQDPSTPQQLFQQQFQSQSVPSIQLQVSQGNSPKQQQLQQQKPGLSLLQQHRHFNLMHRYNQEKANLQQQQFQFTQQARLESQQRFQNLVIQDKSQSQLQLSQSQQQQQQQQTQIQDSSQKLQSQNQQQNVSQMIPKLQPVQIIQMSQPMNRTALNIAGQSSSTQIEQEKQNKDFQNNKNISVSANNNGLNMIEEEESQINQNKDLEQDHDLDEENEVSDNGVDDEDDFDEEYLSKGRRKSKSKNYLNKQGGKKSGLKKKKQNDHSNSKASDSDSSALQSQRRGRKQVNETKNIPKNYSKAIISYIQKHPEQCSKLLGKDYLFQEFESFLVDKKEKLTAIKDLRSLWTTQASDPKQEAYNRVFRILSFKFFRENAVSYIYSSRKIKNTKALITYRFILQRALHDPESFSFMKLPS